MTTTPKLGLTKPTPGERNWTSDRGVTIAENFQKIDDNFDLHDHLSEKTAGHGIVLDSKLDTSITDLSAVGDQMKKLIMVLGA